MKACILQDKHIMLVGWKMDDDGMDRSMTRLVEDYARQLLRNKPNLEGGKKLMEDALVYLGDVKRMKSKQSMDRWEHDLVCYLYTHSGTCGVVFVLLVSKGAPSAPGRYTS